MIKRLTRKDRIMKKTPALLLLTLGGAAGMTLLTLFMMFVSLIAALVLPANGEWALYTALGIFIFLTAYPFKYLYISFKKKYNIGIAVFITCLCLPSAAASIAVNQMYAPPEQSVLSILRLALWMFVTVIFTIMLLIHILNYEVKRWIANPKPTTKNGKESTNER